MTSRKFMHKTGWQLARAVAYIPAILLVSTFSSHAQTANSGLPEIHSTPMILAPSLLAPAASDNTTLNINPHPLNLTLTSLNQAISIAVNRHPSIADSISTLTQSTSNLDIARARYLPKIEAGMRSGTNSHDHDSNNSLVASASQLLYDFGKTDGSVNQAQALIRRQQAQVLKQIDTIAQQTAEALITLHRYKVLYTIATEQLDASERVLGMAELRAEAGLSTHSDPVQAQSRIEAARSTLLQIKTAQAQSRERLYTLLGALPDTESISRIIEKPWGVAEQYIHKEVDLNLLPDILSAEAERQANKASLDISKAQHAPTISLDASVNRAVGSTENTVTQQRNGTYSTIMLNLSVPIYEGGALTAQVRGAASALEAAYQRVQLAQLDSGDRIRLLREQVLGTKTRLSTLENRKKILAEARELYREQYMLGTRSILDLLNTEQEFYQSVSDTEGLRHDLWLSLAAYTNATGMSREFYQLNDAPVQGVMIQP